MEQAERRRAYQGADAFDPDAPIYRVRGEGILGWGDDGGDLPEEDVRRLTMVQRDALLREVRTVARMAGPRLDEVSAVALREQVMAWLDGRMHDGQSLADRGAWTHDLAMSVVLGEAEVDVGIRLALAPDDAEAWRGLLRIAPSDLADPEFLAGLRSADEALSVFARSRV